MKINILTFACTVLFTGAAIAGYTVVSMMAELLSNPVFNAVFVATLSTFNKCVFFLGAGLDMVALIFFGYVCNQLIIIFIASIYSLQNVNIRIEGFIWQILVVSKYLPFSYWRKGESVFSVRVIGLLIDKYLLNSLLLPEFLM